jgi:hypothetical protein
VDLERSAGTGAFYWWERQSVFDGAQTISVEVNSIKSLSQASFNARFPDNPLVPGTIGVVEFYRVAGLAIDPDTGLGTGSGPLGDPLCSLTIVIQNTDGTVPQLPTPVVTSISTPETPVSTPPSVGCEPMPAAAGATVSCTVTGGEPGIDILWRASYNPVFAEAGVTLGADGTGTFSFVVPAAARGEEVMVELVDWAAPMSLGVSSSSGVVPTRIPAGEGPGAPTGPLAVTVALALVAGMVVRRRASGHVG